LNVPDIVRVRFGVHYREKGANLAC
jgi:hypothetical protein